MAFIHKNINSALMFLVAFLSVSLVTVTVYSVGAFDDINGAYVEQAMRADELAAQLKEKQAMTTALQQTAQLNQEREAALAKILEQQKQEAQAQAESTQSSTVTATNTANTVKTQTARTGVYNPYRSRYWPFSTAKLYVK
jgi:hypothetical protein